jgi:SNF2 family DNA or RNA helicase
MNNVGELYSLIHFLRIKPYNEYQRFQSEFGMLTKGNSGKRDTANAMRKLQTVLKAILLRRTKQSEIDGKPIITLPPKSTEIQHVVFSDAELEFYQALESKTQIQFNKYLRQGTVGKNYSNILVLLLRLRQACCHPHLIMDFDAAPPGGEALTLDGMKELAESLQPEVVKRLLEAENFEVNCLFSCVSID